MFLSLWFAWYAQYKVKRGLPAWQWTRISVSSSQSLRSCWRRMVSSREGFLFSMKAAFGQGKAGIEFSIGTSLNISGEVLFSLFGGGIYNESRVE